MSWSIEFFEDDEGRQPAREWLTALERDKRAAVIAAIEVLLERWGLDICSTEHGRQLGHGLFELRVRHDEPTLRGREADRSGGRRRRDILLRVFCHAYGDRVVLLLGGYDKGVAPSSRQQQREIERARKALRTFKLRQKRKSAGEKRRS
jgi:putative component of toxin-antitoxin plasmid stabilization module